jgi:Carboxypeptidase regulatory-like domain
MNPSTAKFVLRMGVLLFLLPFFLQAQAAGSTLSGTVTGPSGEAVGDARVSVTNVATGQSAETQTSPFGFYQVPDLKAGDYEISVSAKGFNPKTVEVTVKAGAGQTANVALTRSSSSGAGALSLGDLGFSPIQTQGSAGNQALLDRRSHMLKIHQTLGLITLAPLIATVVTGPGAKGHHGAPGSPAGRNLHAALGITTAGFYFTAASFAIRAPKPPGIPTRGPIRVHKALAWVHGTGMILTPILGAIAYSQLSNGERIHGIAKLHSDVAWVTLGAYGAAILSVSIKF